MKGLILALQFLTRLPLPRVEADGTAFAAAMRWFPAAGLMIGGLVAGAAWAGARIDAWTGALLALLAWVWVTGALHLDGLADLADAKGAAHRDRERLLAVLADPHVGAMGATAVALQLIAKLVLLHGLVQAAAFGPLLLIPFAARIGPLIWSRWLPPLHDGLGARFAVIIRPVDLALWGIMLLAVAFWAPALLAMAPLAGLWGWWILTRIGGISGDSHGAGIELLESGLLLAVIVWARAS
ncbi:adenosylcobinamide-GDP ribazoletransferase [Sphingobium cupriresistens]|uniref:Adenosylcobinamide-GDP ribazoletransferase n=1 Tax=Sphingobium cupriresistens TaxID=1132417 RepID=A0A8G2DVA7_9SPHN|nr:adenosylcobinamide-GDP ribazoletransferase [Sphingobium cupriresistens]RYM09960.1 adenosylcobinamide-GDP ribazoletransferase [Sphingobium cupriresistens]